MIAYMIMKRRKQLREANTLELFDYCIAADDEMGAIQVLESKREYFVWDYLHEVRYELFSHLLFIY